jgi:hypothetical protein
MATLSLIRDGSIEIWSGGSPANQNVQTTNTTLTQLTRDMSPTHPARLVMPTALGHGESLVKDGQSALRATIAAAGAADEFRIWSPGAIVAALTGATTNPLTMLDNTPGMHFFSFYARCSVEFNSLRVRLHARDASDNFLGSLVGPTSSATSYDWGEGSLRYVDAATSHNVVELKQYWKKYSFAFEVPPTDPNGVQIEHLVWQISNDSAGAQVIDLDDIAFGSLLAQEEVSADG